jgi:dolichol-phosphate mannosyltransferase
MNEILLTVLIPVYNESATIETLLARVLSAPYRKQIIVIDDGSTDGTTDKIEKWTCHPEIILLQHQHNQSKGTAIRTGLAAAQGRFTLIQDADLEYDPADYPRLIEPLRRGEAAVVYGSRYLQPPEPLPWSKFRVAVCLLNLLVRLLYGRRLSDEATCYKAMPTPLFRALELRARRFELCAEITAKVCRLGLPLLEVPISYRPRSALEGKKIGWRDACATLWTLLQGRFLPLPRRHESEAAKSLRIATAGRPMD